MKTKSVSILDVCHYLAETSILTSLEERTGARGLLLTIWRNCTWRIKKYSENNISKMNRVSKDTPPPPTIKAKQPGDTVH